MKIRNAQKHDVDACVPLIYSAAEALFDYIYQHKQISAKCFIHNEFLSEHGYSSYKLHWVVEHHDKIVATVACYGKKDLLGMDQGTLKNIWDTYKLGFPRIVSRALLAGSVVTKPSELCLHIANFGVHPDYRGQGIGSLLLQHLKVSAQQQGYVALSLDVSQENHRGQQLYERIGFKVIKETIFKGARNYSIPNGRRMEWLF
ncbi:N-acetyltransferase [Acinetobacter sp. Ac_5812]|uniref:GNAT family N-acetyltransferase n=1 Tax=Acinetobacter sp. Ac_5812 TaxID=1848937 RepID=UPI00149040B3|nr:N-acetyltransferase [Acinetobacter sp. Ac_5812]NNP70580.1 GNAT family N-acetyltransferase [Acinetobacter sp. Ac_5812]